GYRIQEPDGGKLTPEFIRAALASLPSLKRMEREKLENAIQRSIAKIPERFGSAALDHLRRDVVANIPSLQTGAVLAAERIANVRIPRSSLQLRVHVEDGYYR